MEHDALRMLTRSGEPMRWVLTRGEAQLGRHRRPAAPPPTHPTC